MLRLEMKNLNMNDINREVGQISLSSGKIETYEYLSGEEILLSDQKRVIEQDKFTYSPLSKAFEKQIKTKIKDKQKEKHLKSMGNNKLNLVVKKIL